MCVCVCVCKEMDEIFESIRSENVKDEWFFSLKRTRVGR